MAFDKCPNGMYSEIKYDGERVQVHKNHSEFKYFSRSLKPVIAHKIATFKEHIPKAFPNASELILDAEVLMVDNNTGGNALEPFSIRFYMNKLRILIFWTFFRVPSIWNNGHS